MITREQSRTTTLRQKIIDHGGEAYLCPVMSIEKLRPAEGFECLQYADIVIVLSSNAVPSLKPFQRLLNQKQILAIGDATRRALQQAGIEVDAVPPVHNSEGLLAMDELEAVSDKNIIIVSGKDPRELLAQQLQTRGAAVQTLPVYERRCANWSETDQSYYANMVHKHRINIIIFHSISLVDYFIELLLQGTHLNLHDVACLVISDRIAAYCVQKNIFKQVYNSNGPSDEQILQQLREINKELMT